jgi:hypothetical protein
MTVVRLFKHPWIFEILTQRHSVDGRQATQYNSLPTRAGSLEPPAASCGEGTSGYADRKNMIMTIALAEAFIYTSIRLPMLTAVLDASFYVRGRIDGEIPLTRDQTSALPKGTLPMYVPHEVWRYISMYILYSMSAAL